MYELRGPGLPLAGTQAIRSDDRQGVRFIGQKQCLAMPAFVAKAPESAASR